MSNAPAKSQPRDKLDFFEECYKYGLFAQCAYANNPDTARDFLSKVYVPPGLKDTLDDLLKEKAIKLLKYESPLEDWAKIYTDTEVVLSKLKTDDVHELIMAFRGTEATFNDPETGKVTEDVTWNPTTELISDAVTDLKYNKVPLTDISGLEVKAAELQLVGCEVHEGFQKSFNDLVMGNDADGNKASPLEDAVKQLFNDEKPVRIVCCGHSLGGALCTLAAFWCKATNYLGVTDVRCFAFASPRVGDKYFVEKFDELIGNSSCYRFTYENDLVPSLPLKWMGFKHVSKAVFLKQLGKNHLGALVYDAEMAERPNTWFKNLLRLPPNTSIQDHKMRNYLDALAAKIKELTKDRTDDQQIAQPHLLVHQKEDAANESFLESCKAVQHVVLATDGRLATGGVVAANGVTSMPVGAKAGTSGVVAANGDANGCDVKHGDQQG